MLNAILYAPHLSMENSVIDVVVLTLVVCLFSLDMKLNSVIVEIV